MTAEFGICPVCNRSYKIKDNGTLRKHLSRDGMGKGLPFNNPCEGSGQPPATEEADR